METRNSLNNNINLPFRFLTDKQCEQIYEAALNILGRTGARILYPEAVKMLKDAGCRIDNERVWIPERLVKWALNCAPTGFTMYTRDGKPAMHIRGDNSYFGGGPTCPNFIDLETGQRRPSTKGDVVNTSIISDYLPNIDFVMSLCMISDKPAEAADIHELDAMLRNTNKPIITWAFTAEAVGEQLEMLRAVAGGKEAFEARPNCIVYTEPTTPLTHTYEALRKMLYLAENNVPLLYTPGMLMGAVTPVTIPASLAIGIAENLTGLVLAQLKREGIAYLCSADGTPMHMRTMQVQYGSPEAVMACAMGAEVFKYLNMPTWSLAGATDSKLYDQQASVESTMQIMMNYAVGAHLIHDVGFIEMGMTGCLEGLVIGDEIISAVRALFRRIEISDRTLALDLIDEVGPGGNFLTSDHTIDNYKEELWTGELISNDVFADWKARGSKTMFQRANEKAKKILASYTREPLPADLVMELDSIVKRAEQRVGG
ncbi:MAG: trimethylamine methyltransferase family protein [Oscillospiraceae bacterium]|nr:trimethylamine methyltransferase family protein [Oscillospiraceae bacterium]